MCGTCQRRCPLRSRIWVPYGGRKAAHPVQIGWRAPQVSQRERTHYLHGRLTFGQVRRTVRDLLPEASAGATWNVERCIRYSDHTEISPDMLLRDACRRKAEGIVCKRGDRPYRPGRNADWLKVKCIGREEFVILGWAPPGGTRQGIGSLGVGYYDRAGGLQYAGTVGSGYSGRELLELRVRLEHAFSEPPTVLIAGDELPDRQIRWVRQELVAEVSFTAWSGGSRPFSPARSSEGSGLDLSCRFESAHDSHRETTKRHLLRCPPALPRPLRRPGSNLPHRCRTEP